MTPREPRAEGALEACAREIAELAGMSGSRIYEIMLSHGLRGPELWYPCCGYSVQDGHHPDCVDPKPPHAGIRARTTQEDRNG